MAYLGGITGIGQCPPGRRSLMQHLCFKVFFFPRTSQFNSPIYKTLQRLVTLSPRPRMGALSLTLLEDFCPTDPDSMPPCINPKYTTGRRRVEMEGWEGWKGEAGMRAILPVPCLGDPQHPQLRGGAQTCKGPQGKGV